MKSTLSPPLPLSVFTEKIADATKCGLVLLSILVFSIAIFTFSFIFSLRCDTNEQGIVISWSPNTQANNPTIKISMNQESPSVTLVCPPPIFPECPKVTPRDCPPSKPYTDNSRSGGVTVPPEVAPNSKENSLIVTLYSDSYFGGTPINVTLEEDKCFDLPDGFDNVTSSIRTYGNHVVLCVDRGCLGNCERFHDDDKKSESFGFIQSINRPIEFIQFNDRVSSLKKYITIN